MNGARWGAGFAAAGRFVAEIEAARAGTGKLRPGYVSWPATSFSSSTAAAPQS